MKKIIMYLSVTLLLYTVTALPALALPEAFDVYTSQYEPGSYPRVIDMAGLLTDAEESTLTDNIKGIEEKYDFGVAIVAADTLEGMDVITYSEAVFDGCGYGLGADRDGLMLLISVGDRDWNIDAHAYGATAFNDYGRERIGGIIQPMLSDGDYADAFSSFLELADTFLAEAEAGEPFSSSNTFQRTRNIFAVLPVAAGVSFIIALIVAFILKQRMKTARRRPLAHDYITPGSFRLTAQSDMFLYSSVTRTRRVNSSSNSGSGSSSKGGGSHSHTSGKF